MTSGSASSLPRGTVLHSETVPGGKHESFIDIAKRVIGYLFKH
ncbi:hypothetical protein OKW43_005808 [Paraburkholderia sp. WC7.3g]